VILSDDFAPVVRHVSLFRVVRPLFNCRANFVHDRLGTTAFHLGGLQDVISQAVELEIAFAKDCLPRGILGLNFGLFREYRQHIADRRFERIGLPVKFGAKNPFPWMSETIDLSKEKNFFEKHVTEYQTGGSLSW